MELRAGGLRDASGDKLCDEFEDKFEGKFEDRLSNESKDEFADETDEKSADRLLEEYSDLDGESSDALGDKLANESNDKFVENLPVCLSSTESERLNNRTKNANEIAFNIFDRANRFRYAEISWVAWTI